MVMSLNHSNNHVLILKYTAELIMSLISVVEICCFICVNIKFIQQPLWGLHIISTAETYVVVHFLKLLIWLNGSPLRCSLSVSDCLRMWHSKCNIWHQKRSNLPVNMCSLKPSIVGGLLPWCWWNSCRRFLIFSASSK